MFKRLFRHSFTNIKKMYDNSMKTLDNKGKYDIIKTVIVTNIKLNDIGGFYHEKICM